MLAVSGQLDRSVGGPSVPRERVVDSHRRSIYLEQKRDRLPESMVLFDAPRAVNSCSRRRTSTVALQPLYLLNSPFANQMADALAERVRNYQDNGEDQIRCVIRTTLGRHATPEEIERGLRFVAEHSLEDFCHALITVNEFVYLN